MQQHLWAQQWTLLKRRAAQYYPHTVPQHPPPSLKMLCGLQACLQREVSYGTCPPERIGRADECSRTCGRSNDAAQEASGSVLPPHSATTSSTSLNMLLWLAGMSLAGGILLDTYSRKDWESR